MKIFALDLGNKQTKMVSEKTLETKEKAKVYPSYFLDYEDLGDEITDITNENKQIDRINVSIDPDFEYAWGKDINTVKSSKFINTMMFSKRYTSHSYRLLAKFAIGELARDFEEAKNGILEVEVMTGVPSDDYNETTVKQIVKAFEGDHNVTINGESLNVRVKEVFVIQQPVGTVYNEMLDMDGYIIDDTFMEDTVTVVDIGGGTLIIDTLKALKLDPKQSGQTNNGIYDLYENIENEAVKNGMKGLTSNKIEKILREANKSEGYFYKPNKNESLDITPLVNKAIIKYTRNVIYSYNTTVKDTTEIDRNLFSGGGSNLINQKEVNKDLKYTQYVDYAEIANVTGYYKYCKSIQQRRNETGE